MPRWVGLQNTNVCIVSGSQFRDAIEVPEALDGVSTEELMAHWQVSPSGDFTSKHARKRACELKIAFVGNWSQQCGLSTYNEKLFPEIAKHVGDFRLFIEENDHPTGDNTQFGDGYIAEDKIVTCWRRNESTKVLAEKIKEYNPDIVLIGHEWGLWGARPWLSLMCQLQKYRVITIAHSIFHHPDKVICEAAMNEIVVHLDGAKDVLKNDKKVNAKVCVIPHGCDKRSDKPKPWNFYRSEHTFMQSGFLFAYKGYDNSIRAVAILKEKYPDVFFTGLLSESPHATIEHASLYNQLASLVEELGVQDNVSLIRGFQSKEVVDIYLGVNKAAVFPYISNGANEVYGASGQARGAMARSVPVITSSVPHFSDLPTIKANSPEEMAIELDKLFSSNNNVEWQINRQNKYVEENSWEITAQRYVDMFIGS